MSSAMLADVNVKFCGYVLVWLSTMIVVHLLYITVFHVLNLIRLKGFPNYWMKLHLSQQNFIKTLETMLTDKEYTIFKHIRNPHRSKS